MSGSRNRRMDRRSRLGFAQIFHLNVDELMAVEMAGAMQGKQHAFDLVGLDGVILRSRHVLCEHIGRGLKVGDVMLRREPTDIGCGRIRRHYFRVFGYATSETT